MEKRINIFVGHFGSGKTEFAINYAIKLAKSGKKVTIVDCDIVNTYFRTLDAKEELEALGIKVIAPLFANSNLEMQMIPSDILSVFEDDREIVFDVGGDKDGAVALGAYKKLFEREGYRMFFVINQKRPLTQNASDTIEYMVEIEEASRLNITDLVNNSNLAIETSIDDIISGDALVREISEKTEIPYTYAGVKENIAEEIPDHIKDKAFMLSLYLNLSF